MSPVGRYSQMVTPGILPASMTAASLVGGEVNMMVPNATVAATNATANRVKWRRSAGSNAADIDLILEIGERTCC
jgi:hypothetical protein